MISGCASPQKSNWPKYPEEVSKSECPDSFILGKKYYDRYQDLHGIDVSNFYPAISMLEQAIDKCSSHEYEDDVLFTLANAYFFVGNFQSSMDKYYKVYNRFPHSSFNAGINTAREEYVFIEKCIHSRYLDVFRKAEVYEMHKEYDSAIYQYQLAMESTCSEIKDRAQNKYKSLKYMQ